MIRLTMEIRRDLMEKYLRLQASVFGDFKEIDLSQESMSMLYQIYLKENMMPTIMKEFDVLSQNVKNRPNFIANDNSISISIASNRIDITSDASAGDKMLNKDRFLEVAIKYIKEFFEIFQVGISRMSYIEEGIIKIIDNPMEDKIKAKYINTEHIYNSNKIFEWSSNSVSLDEWDINGSTEKVNLNVTTALRRISAQKDGQPVLLNALVLTQDLNTLAENTALRLKADDVETFLNKAVQKSEEITSITEG